MLENPFASELKIERDSASYGWLARPGEKTPLSIPAFWTAMSLAVALGKNTYPTAGSRARTLEHLTYVQDGLAHYQPNNSAGWNLFPHQQVSAQHNVYAATVALMALLELRRADLSWQGSVEERDRLLRQTFDWLVGQFDRRGNPPGWKAGDDGANMTFDGLSLRIYGRLLDAEAEAGLTIPPAIVLEIPRHLAGIVARTLDFPDSSAEFYSTVAFDAEEFVARKSISFPWYSAALDCAPRWLRSKHADNAAVEDLVAVKRALNHLIIALGDEAVTKALDGITTYQAAEMLYALSAVMPLRVQRK